MIGAPLPASRPLPRWLPFLVFLTVFLAVAATTRDYGITWDEPAYFHASDLHVQWLSRFYDDGLHGRIDRAFDDKEIQAAWHWDPYHVPHPPFSRLISGLTNAVAGPFVDKFVGYRLGPAVFFALLAMIMCRWMTELFGLGAGLFSVAAIVLMPNLFAYAHIAVTDLPLAALWFVTAYCFWKGLNDWRWSVAAGIVWGLALATKFPAFLIIAPLIVWAHIYYRRCYANNLFSMIFIAPAIMVATQPYLWHQTAIRILSFFYEGLSRGYRADANFPVYFLHQLTLTKDLPRYYPFFLTAVTTPETLIGLALVGIIMTFRNASERPILVLFLINALYVFILGLLPGAVLHDGMRQMISVYPFIVALATAGFSWLVNVLSTRTAHLDERFGNVKAKIASVLAVLALVPPLIDLLVYHPYELSYYNRFVGGIRGASTRGFELTYFMEALTPEFLDYLNRTLPQNARVNGFFANFMLEYYQTYGMLRPDIRLTKDAFDYALVLNRRSVTSVLPAARELMKRAPDASVSLAGVPLVLLYKNASN